LLSITAYFACGSMVLLLFFHNNVARSATLLWKRMGSSALPEANRASCPGRRLVWNRPRKSCYVDDQLPS
jgi:hypothetical protein